MEKLKTMEELIDELIEVRKNEQENLVKIRKIEWNITNYPQYVKNFYGRYEFIDDEKANKIYDIINELTKKN